MSDKRTPKPAQTYNFHEGVSVIAVEDLKQGDLITTCGLSGRQMFVRKASKETKQDLYNDLLVAKHDMPGCYEARPSNQNYGIALPWLVLTKGVDTTEAAPGDSITLDADGAYKIKGPGRKVGHVLRVGPASPIDGGDPLSGAILLKP